MDSLWENVKSDPSDFQSWTQLAKLAEDSSRIDVIRNVLSSLLSEYPLCFGYWRKWVDQEISNGHLDTAFEVLERASASAEHCIEVWEQYCTLSQQHKSVEEARSVFERAVQSVGTDYNSETIWSLYIDFEFKQGYAIVFSIYYRILGIPLKELEKFYSDFVTLAESRPFREYALPSELLTETSEDELKNTILDNRKTLYTQSLETRNARESFERGIQRHYFHVKPLPESELSNWRNYLDFEESQFASNSSSLLRTKQLYERALIATAPYPEFWIRYARFLQLPETSATEQEVRTVLQRATFVHTKRRYESSIALAEFEESNGYTELAEQWLAHVTDVLAPGVLEGVLARVRLLRRLGKLEEVRSVYINAMLLLSDGSKGIEALVSLCIHFSKFLNRDLGLVDDARAVFTSVKLVCKGNVEYWLGWILFESDLKENQLQVVIKDALDHVKDTSKRSQLWNHVFIIANDRFSSISSIHQLRHQFHRETHHSSLQTSEEPHTKHRRLI